MNILQLRTTSVLMGLACALATACDDDNGKANHPSYLIFVEYYGECGGNGCVDIYKLEAGAVYEDNKNNYPSMDNPYDGEYLQRTNINIDEIKDLLNEIPGELYDEHDKVLGQPDAGDWGGYYVEVQANGERRHWLIDKQQFTGNRAYLNAFTSAIQAKLDLLEQTSNQ
jgi:hypothetical protein